MYRGALGVAWLVAAPTVWPGLSSGNCKRSFRHQGSHCPPRRNATLSFLAINASPWAAIDSAAARGLILTLVAFCRGGRNSLSTARAVESLGCRSQLQVGTVEEVGAAACS